ncbi:hypothetical protein [Sporomusa aerivorans]|uniref:hypothetical protein n=1 Tax=Sporomusa aerivorans TaxID=204936 RepID=UPI00352A674C
MVPTLPAPAHIAAIIPCYTDLGDSTRIIMQNGGIITFPTRLKGVVQKLAKSRAIDLVTLKTNTRLTTARKNMTPLPIAPGLVLVPLKVRKPRIAGDVTTGYVNLQAVSAVKVSPHSSLQATVTLIGATELSVLWSVDTVRRQLALARLSASASPLSQPVAAAMFRENYPGYAPELLTLAVKLVDVFNEILCIKQKQT